MQRTQLDLFSGIGGFALACRWLGIETIGFCEIEPYAQRVLRKNFPGVPIIEDVRNFPADDFQRPWLITGGYPCQPFSQAGMRRGEKDDRHLWPAMFEIIRSCRPDWVLAENVAGHVSMGLDEVLSDLESEDYTCQPIIIPACAVDAPHRRDRVWIVGHAKSKHCNECREYSEPSERSISESGKSSSAKTLAYSTNKGRGFRGVFSENEKRQRSSGDALQYSKRRKTVWLTEPNVGRVAHGIPNRVDRLRGLGNAIVPQVAYEIINAMIKADEKTNESIL